MTHKWKGGDRFTLEFVVDRVLREGLVAVFAWGEETALGSIALQHAKLIQPAAPEPQNLDVTKPMRDIEMPELRLIYVGRTSYGRAFCEIEGETNKFWVGKESNLENIPEPKRTTTQIVELVNFDFGPRIMMKSAGAFYVNVASRAKVSHTEGEGWSIEEVL